MDPLALPTAAGATSGQEIVASPPFNPEQDGQDLDSDTIIFFMPKSSFKKWTRFAFLVVILLLIAVGIALGVNNEKIDPPLASSSQAATQEANPLSVQTEAPKPAPTPEPPRQQTLNPTDGGTMTVHAEASSPPTFDNYRGDDGRTMIQSPTWHE